MGSGRKGGAESLGEGKRERRKGDEGGERKGRKREWQKDGAVAGGLEELQEARDFLAREE